MNHQRPTKNSNPAWLAGICALMAFPLLMIAQAVSQSAPSTPGTAPQAGNAAKAPAGANGGIEGVKALIKATDEEWKVIGPKLQALVTARQVVTTYSTPAAGRGGFGGGGFPNFGPDSFSGPSNDMGRGGRGGPGGGGFPAGFDPANFAGGRGFPPGFDPANPAAGRGAAPSSNPASPAGGRGVTPGSNAANDAGGRGFPAGFDPAAMGAMGGGPGGPGGFGADNAVSSALAELKTAVDDPTTPPEQVKAKLAAVRSARQRASVELDIAQKALLALLTADQEVILVSLGYLD